MGAHAPVVTRSSAVDLSRLVRSNGTQPCSDVDVDNICLKVMPVQLDEKSLTLWRHADAVQTK